MKKFIDDETVKDAGRLDREIARLAKALDIPLDEVT